MVVNVVLDLSPSAKYFAPSAPILLRSKLMVVNVLLDLSPSAKYFAPSSPILLQSKLMVVNVLLDFESFGQILRPFVANLIDQHIGQIDGCQCVVGLESFGQILRPFGANFIIDYSKLMVVNVVLDLSPSAKYFAPSSPILLVPN